MKYDFQRYLRNQNRKQMLHDNWRIIVLLLVSEVVWLVALVRFFNWLFTRDWS
jgi:hypothetical protein